MMTDRYSEMKRANLKAKSTAIHVANVFIGNSIVPYDIVRDPLMDNLQLLSNFFATLVGIFGLDHLNTTAYSSQMNEQVESHKKTIFTRYRR